MTLREAMAASRLEHADAEILLAHVLAKSRTWLAAHDTEELSAEHTAQFSEWAARRRQHEPVAYITGTKEFFGHTFHVTPDVLIPRPATEELVSFVLAVLQSKEPQAFQQPIDNGIVAWVETSRPGSEAACIVDIGTGSGCIAVSLALAQSKPVIATDSSERALAIAKENAHALGAQTISFRLGPCLDPIMNLEVPFLLVSNPPYIPEGVDLARDVAAFEPHEALFAGTDGTDVLQNIVTQARAHPHCVGLVIECRKEQPPRVRPI